MPPEAVRSTTFFPGALRTVAVVALLGVPALARGQASEPEAPMPPYPGATSFCADQVIGKPKGHPSWRYDWTAYYAIDPPETVAAWYLSQLGPAGHRRQGTFDFWINPLDDPTSTAMVRSVGDPGPIDRCKERPPKTAKTVIILTKRVQPNP